MVIIQMDTIKNVFILVLTWFVGADLNTVLASGFVFLSLSRIIVPVTFCILSLIDRL